MSNEENFKIVQYKKWIEGKLLMTTCEEGVVKLYDLSTIGGCPTLRESATSFFELDGVPECSPSNEIRVVGVNSNCTSLVYININTLIENVFGDIENNILNEFIARIEEGECMVITKDTSGDQHTLSFGVDKECLLEGLSIEDIGDFPARIGCNSESYDIEPEGDVCEPCESACIPQTLKSCGGSFYRECDDCNNERLRQSKIGLVLNTSVHLQTSSNNERKFYFSGSAIPALDSAGWIHEAGDRNVYLRRNKITELNGSIRIDVPGDYLIGWSSSQEQNIGIHGTRVGIVAIFPSGVIGGLNQSRYSGVDGFLYGDQPAVDGNEWHAGDNIRTTAQGGTSTGDPNSGARAGGTFSMGRIMERYPNQSSIPMFLPSGTILVPMCKVSTVMTGDTEAQMGDYAGDEHNGLPVGPTVSILGLAEDSADGGDGARMRAINIDDECMKKYWLRKYSLGGF